MITTIPAPLIIAHRGDSSSALENSREAVCLALALPVGMVEVDIRKSRDNCLYVIHDKDTGRTADGDIDIERAESDEISSVRLKNGESIPTLTDILELVAAKVALNLEIKSEGAGGLCAAHLVGSGYRGPMMLSSFKEREVLDARRVMPSLICSEIFDDFTPKDVARYAAKGYSVISLRRRTVTRALIDSCHDRGIKVYVWTVDDEDEIRKFAGWAVDGIYSNRPKALKETLERMTPERTKAE